VKTSILGPIQQWSKFTTTSSSSTSSSLIPSLPPQTYSFSYSSSSDTPTSRSTPSNFSTAKLPFGSKRLSRTVISHHQHILHYNKRPHTFVLQNKKSNITLVCAFVHACMHACVGMGMIYGQILEFYERVNNTVGKGITSMSALKMQPTKQKYLD